MFDSCLSIDFDWCYEESTTDKRVVMEEPVTCCECGEEIPAGTSLERFVGKQPPGAPKPGTFDTFYTCKACVAISNSLAGGERKFGSLDDYVEDAYNLGLTEVPDSAYWDLDSLWNQYPPYHDALVVVATPPGHPKITKLLAALHLLDDFLSDEQIVAVFEQATAARQP